MSTETVSAIRDGKPRTATSTFTQLLSSGGMSSSVLLYAHRARTTFTQLLSSGGMSSSVLLYAHRARTTFTQLLSSEGKTY